jgi:hypothetical protein
VPEVWRCGGSHSISQRGGAPTISNERPVSQGTESDFFELLVADLSLFSCKWNTSAELSAFAGDASRRTGHWKIAERKSFHITCEMATRRWVNQTTEQLEFTIIQQPENYAPTINLRKFTVAELLERSKQALRATVEGVPYARNWVLPHPEKCLADGSPRAMVFSRLAQLMPMDLPARARHHLPASDALKDEGIVRAAGKALEGRFNLLGFPELHFGRPVDWHAEPTSDKRSPLVHWKRLDSLSNSITGDKKVVWELNRHQHLLIFGRAFLQTGDERYAQALVDDIVTWIHDNPPGIGINWVSSLEVAFRCMNWLRSIAMIRQWSKWPSLPLLGIEQSLYAQGRHIECYLSTYFSPNTHLTGEALGLYYLGTCLPELKCAERWRNLGRSILLRQLEVQVRPDGVYFEQSSWYQRYTADFYMHFVALAERAGDSIPRQVHERLIALLDLLMWITKPDGTSPYLGDDDGGALVRLDACASNDWRPCLSNGAVLFRRGDYKHVAGKCAEETVWLFGSDAREIFEDVATAAPEVTSRAFVDGGIYVMRSGWESDSNYLLVDCGPHGAMNFGHAHADALSIEVAARGASILTDPGTFTYTASAEMRDLFRSTAMHNTLTIDGVPSSVPSGPFKWKHVAKSTLRCWHDHPSFSFFHGSHDGYRRLPDPAVHSREVFFVNREYWFMLDRVEARGGHECTAHFHLTAGADATFHHETGRLEALAASTTLEVIYPEMMGAWSVTDGLVSPCYGAKEEAQHATYSVRTTGSAAILSVLFPRVSGQLSPEIRNLNPDHGKGLVLATEQFRDLFLWAGRGLAAEGIQGSDFEWVWMRHSSGDGRLELAIFLHGTTITSGEIELMMDGPAEYVVISMQEDVFSINIVPPVGFRLRLPMNSESVVVNGRKHAIGAGESLVVAKPDVFMFGMPQNQTDFCQHVRH